MKKLWNRYKNGVILVALSVVIIAAGVFIPELFIKVKSGENSLPKGSVDIASVDPYGSANIITERLLVNSIESADRFVTGYSFDSDDEAILTGEKINDLGLIGQNTGLPSDDKSVECIYELLGIIGNDLHYDLLSRDYYSSVIYPRNTPERAVVRLADTPLQEFSINADSGMFKESEEIIMDRSTGVPVLMGLEFLSPDVNDLYQMTSRIVSIYSEYTGIDFSTEDEEWFYSYRDGYDISYQRCFLSPDKRIRLYIVIFSGWHWDPPESDGASWIQTDNFEWTVSISLGEE